MEILVMDNDKNLADSISCELEQALVRYAADGEVGLKIALDKQFDLIVLDWALHKKDGLRVLKKLREHKILTPILMLTGEDSVKNVVISLDSGANDCVTKPFEMHVLLARMKALIRRSKWDLCAEIRHCHVRLDSVISILIADSCEFSRTTIARLLAHRLPNAIVHATDDLQKGFELCVNLGIDIVISDMKLKFIDSRNVFQRIREAKRSVRFIITTGSSANDELNEMSNMDNACLLRKPIDLGELLDAINLKIGEIEVERQST